MKILVFGGAGFLGSHVADKLSDEGYQVTIFDINKSPWLRENQKIIIGNILDFEAVKNAIDGQDIVYNFAGIADIDCAKDQPINTIQLNILGSANILQACVELSIKRYVFASTVYVYSKSGSFYRASKKACEDYIELYNERFGQKYTILRYGTLYGPRSDSRNAIFRYVKSALDTGKIKYSGEPDAKREYIHVYDAATASVKILEDKFINQNITLTGSQTYYVKELLEMIKEILNGKVTIEHLSERKMAHYKLTPYNFVPKFGKKYISELQVDIGQGLLGVIEEIYHNKIE